MNCILGGLWLDGNDELPGSAIVIEAAEAEDGGSAAAADEVGRPRVKPGMLQIGRVKSCLLYTSPSPRDMYKSRMPSSA